MPQFSVLLFIDRSQTENDPHPEFFPAQSNNEVLHLCTFAICEPKIFSLDLN